MKIRNLRSLFAYVDQMIQKNGSASFHPWGSEKISSGYEFITNTPSIIPGIVQFAGRNYLVTEYAAVSGRGGMDDGSPHEFIFKPVPETVVLKEDESLSGLMEEFFDWEPGQAEEIVSFVAQYLREKKYWKREDILDVMDRERRYHDVKLFFKDAVPAVNLK